jgi:hypothetical protein
MALPRLCRRLPPVRVTTSDPLSLRLGSLLIKDTLIFVSRKKTCQLVTDINKDSVINVDRSMTSGRYRLEPSLVVSQAITAYMTSHVIHQSSGSMIDHHLIDWHRIDQVLHPFHEMLFYIYPLWISYTYSYWSMILGSLEK